MMAADYRHIGDRENRLGRHYSRFSAFWPAPTLAGQSLALRKLCDAGSNRRSRAKPSTVGTREGAPMAMTVRGDRQCSASAHEPGSVDSPKTTFVSLAAVAEWAQPLQRT